MGIAATCRSRSDSLKSVISIKTKGRGRLGQPEGDAIKRLAAFYLKESVKIPEPLKPFYEQVLAETHFDTTRMLIRICRLGETGAKYLCKILPYFTHIKELMLWKTALDLQAIEHLSSSLTTVVKLEVLGLEDNSLKDDSVLCLSRSFKLLKELKELWLSSNNISQVGAEMLARSLADLQSLETLNLDFNFVRSDGCTFLCRALIPRSRLKIFSLRSNLVDSSACSSLLALGMSNPPVKLLDLQNNSLSVKDCEALVQVFGDTVSLAGQGTLFEKD